MKKFWLIEIEGTPKAIERFEDLLDELVTEVSYNSAPKSAGLRGLVSYWFKTEASLKRFVGEFK